MKKTQMIYSPSTFRLGLGLIVAAGLISMPVLTGAGDGADGKPSNSKTKAKPKSRTSTIEKQSASALREQAHKGREKKSPAPAERRLTDTETIKLDGIERQLISAEARARVRAAQLEQKAAKLGIRFSPEQKKKLISRLKKEITSQSKKSPTKKVAEKNEK